MVCLVDPTYSAFRLGDLEANRGKFNLFPFGRQIITRFLACVGDNDAINPRGQHGSGRYITRKNQRMQAGIATDVLVDGNLIYLWLMRFVL